MTPGRMSAKQTMITASRHGKLGLVGRLMVLLLSLASTTWGAEMVTNGGFDTTTNWSYAGAPAPVYTTAQNHGILTGAGSSVETASGRNKTMTGTATQSVSVAVNSVINSAADVSLWAMEAWTGLAGGTRSVSIDLRYQDATTVQIFSGTIGANSPWTNITNTTATVFPLTLTQNVNQITVTITTSTGNNASATSNLYVDDLAISYTAAASDALTVTGNTAVATTANPGTNDVQMEYLQVNADNAGNGSIVLTSVTAEDINIAATGVITNLKVHVDNDTNYINGVLGTATVATWNGEPTVVDLTGIAVANRTVTTGIPKYLWITYDVNAATPDPTLAQARVTAIGVLAPDTAPLGGPWDSNVVLITQGLGCGGCHPNPMVDGVARDPASGGVEGDHTKHASAQGYECELCHLATPSTPRHRNTLVELRAAVGDVANARYDKNGDHAHDASWAQATVPVRGRCENTNCHGGVNSATSYGGPTGSGPQWGTANPDTCTFCHNSNKTNSGGTANAYPAAASPFRSTSAAGAHATHLSGTVNLMNGGVVCADCHTVPAGITDAGHMDELAVPPYTQAPADLTWGADAQLNTTTPSYAAGSCTVYCHGANTPGGDAGATDATPAWTADWTTYVPGTAGTCSNMCHGLPPTSTAHNSQAFPTSCTSCHPDTVTSTANPPAIAVGYHINGTVEASGGACDGCHGYPPSISDGKAYLAVEGKGAHPKHVTHLQNRTGLTLNAATDTYGDAKVIALCGVCHDMNAATHEIGGGTRNINFNGSTGYQFGPTAISYNGTQGQGSAVDPKNCSNVRCHYSTTPVWE